MPRQRINPERPLSGAERQRRLMERKRGLELPADLSFRAPPFEQREALIAWHKRWLEVLEA